MGGAKDHQVRRQKCDHEEDELHSFTLDASNILKIY